MSVFIQSPSLPHRHATKSIQNIGDDIVGVTINVIRCTKKYVIPFEKGNFFERNLLFRYVGSEYYRYDKHEGKVPKVPKACSRFCMDMSCCSSYAIHIQIKTCRTK